MLTHGFEAPALAHFDGDHGHFYAEDASNEWLGECVLDHVEEAARCSSSSWQSTVACYARVVTTRLAILRLVMHFLLRSLVPKIKV